MVESFAATYARSTRERSHNSRGTVLSEQKHEILGRDSRHRVQNHGIRKTQASYLDALDSDALVWYIGRLLQLRSPNLSGDHIHREIHRVLAELNPLKDAVGHIGIEQVEETVRRFSERHLEAAGYIKIAQQVSQQRFPLLHDLLSFNDRIYRSNPWRYHHVQLELVHLLWTLMQISFRNHGGYGSMCPRDRTLLASSLKGTGVRLAHAVVWRYLIRQMKEPSRVENSNVLQGSHRQPQPRAWVKVLYHFLLEMSKYQDRQKGRIGWQSETNWLQACIRSLQNPYLRGGKQALLSSRRSSWGPVGQARGALCGRRVPLLGNTNMTRNAPEDMDVNNERRITLALESAMPERVDILGQRHLDRWRGAAGKSKSWRRYTKIRRSAQVPRKALRGTSTKNDVFYRPLIWIPVTFIRGKTCHMKRSTRKPVSLQKQIRSANKRNDGRSTLCEDDLMASVYKSHEEGTDYTPQLDLLTEDHAYLEPPKPFIRLTFQHRKLIQGQERTDHFLPLGLVLTHQFQVQAFIRNDAHAEVYMVRDRWFQMHEHSVHNALEAHVFLNEYYGKSEMYAKRRKRAMRESDNGETVIDEFWLYRHVNGHFVDTGKRLKKGENSGNIMIDDVDVNSARHVILLRVEPRVREFRLHRNDKEFPKLPTVQGQTLNSKLPPRCNLRGKNTYAAVARRKSKDGGKAWAFPQRQTRVRKEQQQPTNPQDYVELNDPIDYDDPKSTWSLCRDMRNPSALRTPRKYDEYFPIIREYYESHLAKFYADMPKPTDMETAEFSRLYLYWLSDYVTRL